MATRTRTKGAECRATEHGSWLYVEANAYPGYLTLLATHGTGSNSLLEGFYFGAELLATVLIEEFGHA